MAAPVKTRIEEYNDAVKITWTLTTADATGDGIALPEHPDRCWHATGTWGGATATMQGSNTDTDGLYSALLNAVGGASITWTADGATKNSVESCLYVRPKLTTAGTGATVVVVLIARKQPRGW